MFKKKKKKKKTSRKHWKPRFNKIVAQILIIIYRKFHSIPFVTHSNTLLPQNDSNLHPNTYK